MLELKGKYNTAKIFTDVVDQESISQVMMLLNQEFVSDSKIRMMPDIHAGSGCTIGTTMTITDKIVPNLVGVDIGCGMECVQLSEKEIDLEKLDKLIYERIPSGFAIRDKIHPYYKHTNVDELICADVVDYNRAERSIGTLGGGNHFIECNRDSNGDLYLVVHSGSRHLGLEVANHYQRFAYAKLNGHSKQDIHKLVEELKAAGRHREIEKELAKLRHTKRTHIPKDLCYVYGEIFDNYIHDMKLVQEYATWNRMAIVDEIVDGLGLHVVERFTTIHNYIDTENMILRKGAVSAQKGEKLLIPINMRDGSLICVGKGNPDWNYSAPHGAGRLMSRSKAKELFTVDAYAAEMEGIYTTSVSRSTLDECPMAYKNMEAIVNNIGDTVDILEVIKPIYNFKAGEEMNR